MLESIGRFTRWRLAYGVLILLGVFTSISVIGFPVVATGELPWSSNRPIEWDDFQGVPPDNAENMPQAAEIHTTIRWHLQLVMEYDCQHHLWEAGVNRDSLVVTNAMNPSLSWVAPGKQSYAILKHEQGHFDLNEVYRRKLQNALLPLAAEGDSAEEAKKALQERINKTAEEILDQLAKTQERYDEETCHGTDQQGQEAWNKKIDSWLVDPSQAP